MGKTIGIVLALKDKCSPNMKKIADAMGITEQKAKQLDGKIKKVGRTFDKELKPKLKTISIGLMAVGSAMGALAIKGIKMAGNLEQYNKAFETMLGSQDRAKKLMQDIIHYADKTPFEMPELVTSTQRLLSFGVGADEVIDKLGRLGDLAQGNGEKLDSLTGAFGKIRAKGKASMLELKSFINAGIPILDALAKQQKTTTAGLLDMLSKGKIGYREVEKAVVSLTSKGGQYYQMVLKQSQTLDGVLSTLSDSFNLMLADTMQRYLPQVKKLVQYTIDNMPRIQKIFITVFDSIGNTIDFFAKHIDITIFALTALGTAFATFQVATFIMSVVKVIKVIREATIAQGIWNAVMMANPIGAVAVGVGLLVAGIVLLIKHWEKVVIVAKQAWEIMTKIGKVAFNALPIGRIVNNVANAKEQLQKHALGTSYASGGLSLVGEQGAELVNLPRGAEVIPAQKTKEMLTSNQTISINVNIAGNMIGNNEFINNLKNTLAIELKTALATM